MPTVIYNTFYPWIKQDNYLVGQSSLIDAKNMDWLKDWQWITLWPKINKTFISNSPIRAIDAEQLSNEDLNRSIAGWDNGEIYKLNSSDNTPVYTITWQNIVHIDTLWLDYIIFTKASLNNAIISIYKIAVFDLQSWNYASLSSPLLPSALSHYWCPPTLVVGSDMFIWGNDQIKKFDWTTITDTYTFPDDYVNWLTLQGSTIWVYTRSWNTYNWDWWSTIESARWYVWARVDKVVSLNGVDYQTTEDWQLKKWLYNQFIRLFKPKTSFRLEDNSQLQRKLDFAIDDPDSLQNRTSISALDDLYFYTKDSVKGIYKYWNIIPWTAQGIHKIITQNHEWTQIDFIYDMYFYERTARKLYFSYKAWATYWVDYIDLDDLESCNNWYAITQVFTWWTSFKKELNVVRISVSNVDSTNTAKLYYRINNQEWILLRTINNTTDDIYNRQNISKEADWIPFSKFIDIQFKIELESSNNDNTPPTLNELMIDYNIIET